MRSLQWFRFAVFGIWLVTLAVVLGVFIASLMYHDMKFPEIRSSLASTMALVMPQMGIMLAFFFGASKAKQKSILRAERGIARLAVALSIFYHVLFWTLLVLGVVFGRFGNTIDDNAVAVGEIMGLIGAIGLSPVAYLFARGESPAAEKD